MKTRIMLCLLALLSLIAASCGSDGSVVTDRAADTPSDITDAVSDSDGDAEDDAMADNEDAMADDQHNAADDAMADEDAMDDDAMDDEEAMADDAMADEDAMADDAMADEDAMADDAMADDSAMDDGTLRRIVSLSPTGTEMLFAVGAGDQVVAVDSFSYFPVDAPVTELSAYEPNVEAIAGFEPDIVISSGPIEGLDAVGIENIVLPAATNFDDIYAQIEQVGALTGNVGQAAELVLEMQTEIDAAVASVGANPVPLTYYHELDNTLYSVTSGTFVGYVYDQFGLTNVADPADKDGAAFGYPQLTEEYLVTADPDIIFLADTLCCEQSAETVAARPGWDQLRAVQSGNVVELNDDIVSRWGPRIVDFVEAIATAILQITESVSS